MKQGTNRAAGSRIKCAECLHCKVFKQAAPSGRYILKCRCAKGHWRKGQKDLTCELHMVSYRRRIHCVGYQSTSDDAADREKYNRSLDDFLPAEQHIFEPDGSVVSKLETMTWDPDT